MTKYVLEYVLCAVAIFIAQFVCIVLLYPGFDEAIVNMPGLGAKVCDTQGLIYYNYTMGKDKVPVFLCTKNVTKNVFIQDHFIQYKEVNTNG